MKTLKQFLFEEKTEQDLIQFLKENCSEVCNDVKKYNKFLWRGMETLYFMNIYEIVGLEFRTKIITPHKNRRPKDTPLWAHEVMDDWFEKHFNERPRSTGVFCAPRRTADTYGDTCIVLPIGEYKILWSSKVTDLSNILFPVSEIYPGTIIYWKNQGYKNKEEIPREKFIEYINTELSEFNYSDTDKEGAYKHRGEIMVLCDKYLSIKIPHDTIYLEEITKLIHETV